MASQCALFVVGLFLALACLLSSAEGTGGRPSSRPRRRPDRRIYSFAFAYSESDPPFDVIDETSGQLKGLGVDVMKKACQLARKKCVTVTSDDCYDNKKQSSLVLNSHWYNACANFYHTLDRGRSYAFIGIYAQEPPAFLYAKAGSSISSVSPATQTVGVHAVFRTNNECLKRHDMDFQTVVTKDTFDDLKSALDSGEVDVAFLLESDASGYKKLGSKISCAESGPAFMIRKDMVREMRWFDRAVKKLIRTRDFKRMCRTAKAKYGGGDPYCLVR